MINPERLKTTPTKKKRRNKKIKMMKIQGSPHGKYKFLIALKLNLFHSTSITNMSKAQVFNL